MKRLIALLLLISLLMFGCTAPDYRDDITLEEIVAAYEAAGYSVWWEVYEEKLDIGEIGSIQANHPNGEYIYFSFFKSEEEAKAYKEEYYHPSAMWLFSVIYGQPSWLCWEVYGCFVVQYDDPELFKPFQELLKST